MANITSKPGHKLMSTTTVRTSAGRHTASTESPSGNRPAPSASERGQNGLSAVGCAVGFHGFVCAGVKSTKASVYG